MRKRSWIAVATLAVVTGAVVYLSVPFAKAVTPATSQSWQVATHWPAQVHEAVATQAKTMEADAVIALHGDQLVAQSGDVTALTNVASVRKSIISALFGIATAKGLVSLDDTLEQLQIDEMQHPLTADEKKATVRDLLQAQSGVYLPSIGESAGMVEKKPKRGSHPPGTFFYYNNWDFNALGVIFEKQTGLALGDAFHEWIAKPTGMQHFDPSHVVYETSEETEMRMYRFYLSAEDLARFGSLYLTDGKWQGQPIIPAPWIEESFTAYNPNDTQTNFYDGYGYLWWIDKETETVWAEGSGGQYLIVDRKHNLVVVTRNNTGASPLGSQWYRWFGQESLREEPLAIRETLLTYMPK